MFTGLIRHTGRVAALQQHGDDARLIVEYQGDPLTAEVGDSIAVNGACLTALQPDRRGFQADLSAETLACTTLGQLQPGDQLNLEPSMRLGDSLDGHLVSGHVDALGSVRAVIPQGDSTLVWFDVPERLLPLIAAKGSIAVDGISLTVNETDATGFRVQLIAHTRQVTTLHELSINSPVNLEVDLIARYVARLARFGPSAMLK